MPCPTCSHTLAAVVSVPDRIFHCARCGTLVIESPGGGTRPEFVPRLVSHARALVAALDDGHRLGGPAYLAKRAVREAATGRPDRD